MKKIIKIAAYSLIINTLFIGSLNAQTYCNKKTLIVYFSWGGNTRTAVNNIKNMIKADVFEIKTTVPYPQDINVCGNQARNELNNNVLPQLSGSINNLENYDIVLLCYPNWWNTVPQAVKQALLTHDFGGKKIAPLCTYGDGGIGRSVRDITSLCPNSEILTYLSIQGERVNNSQNNIREWLKKINLL